MSINPDRFRSGNIGRFFFRCTGILSFCIVATCLTRCQSSGLNGEELFNGRDLSGWDTYLRGWVDDSTKKVPGLGLNSDPYKVFSVVLMNGRPAIRVSGEYFGGLSTQTEYANYHLTLQFRWGEKKISSFKNRKRDSGLLYHAVGKHGADYGAWMRSQEFQIQETDCGDYWGVAGGVFDVPASRTSDSLYAYDPAAPMVTFKDGSAAGRRCIKRKDTERAHGEWNTLDLYCLGDTSVHVVNGTVVMILYRSRQTDGITESPLTSGKIQLQSEGTEIYYRSIRIEPIDALPAKLYK